MKEALLVALAVVCASHGHRSVLESSPVARSPEVRAWVTQPDSGAIARPDSAAAAAAATHRARRIDAALAELFGPAFRRRLIAVPEASDSLRFVYRYRRSHLPLLDRHIVLALRESESYPEVYWCDRCLAALRDSTLPVSAAEAIEIAKEAGLQAGLLPWEISFDRLTWMVKNTLERDGATARGHGIEVDPRTGSILQHFLWKAQP